MLPSCEEESAVRRLLTENHSHWPEAQPLVPVLQSRDYEVSACGCARQIDVACGLGASSSVNYGLDNLAVPSLTGDMDRVPALLLGVAERGRSNWRFSGDLAERPRGPSFTK